MSEIRHTPIHLTFREPLVTARGRIESRRGFLLGMEHERQQFVSEVSLLPEFGTEYFEHSERVLEGETMMMPSAPATVFGLDCIRYGIERQTTKSISVPIAYLLPSDNAVGELAAAFQAYKQGYRAFKLKIGFRSVEEDVKIVKAFCRTIPAKLRLDVNMAWALEPLEDFLSQIDCLRIEWIEDPSPSSLDKWDILQSKYRVEFACDEAAHAQDLLETDEWHGFQVLIVKPSRTGTIADVIRLCDKAREQERKIVFSSMCESSIGMTYLAHLAAEYGTPDVAHGLGTLRLLKDDTISPSLSVTGGILKAPPLESLSSMMLPMYVEQLWKK